MPAPKDHITLVSRRHFGAASIDGVGHGRRLAAKLGAQLSDLMQPLLERWRGDPGGTYQTWFLWEERIKNFRSIRRVMTG